MFSETLGSFTSVVFREVIIKETGQKVNLLFLADIQQQPTHSMPAAALQFCFYSADIMRI